MTLNFMPSGAPLPSLMTAAQAVMCCKGSEIGGGGDLLLPLGICSPVCNALVPGFVSAGPSSLREEGPNVQESDLPTSNSL